MMLNKSGVDSSVTNAFVFPDTVVNKLRIDSVEYNIKRIDSTIINYNTYEKEVIKDILSLDDSATVAKFYELLRMPSTGEGQ